MGRKTSKIQQEKQIITDMRQSRDIMARVAMRESIGGGEEGEGGGGGGGGGKGDLWVRVPWKERGWIVFHIWTLRAKRLVRGDVARVYFCLAPRERVCMRVLVGLFCLTIGLFCLMIGLF